MKKLIIIPAYNEEKNIVRVVDEIREKYSQYDYIVVNDGSKDNTAKVCMDHGYELINLPVNLGLAGAFQTGLKYAYIKGYDYAIQFDADGQHKMEYVEKILEEIEKGYDIVIGSRFVTKKTDFIKNARKHYDIYRNEAYHRQTIKDPTSGMRMFNKQMIRSCFEYELWSEPDTISYLIKQGATISEVQVEMDERMEGESYLNFSRSMLYMLRMLISIMFIQSFRKRK